LADRYCRNCGYELAETERFCPNCGTAVHETAHVPTPEADELKPEERNRVYKLLGLKVLARENGDFEVKWALGGAPCGDNEPLLLGSCRTRGR
jgi:hypothetical protein